MSMTGLAVRYFNVIATASLIFIASAFGLLGYWLFYDTEPPIDDIHGEFIGMDPHSPRVAIVRWTGTRKRSCPGVTRRWLVDGHIVALPPHHLPYAPPADRGQTVSWQMRVEIPRHLDHPVRYQIEHSYVCNPLHQLAPLMVYPPPVPLWHDTAAVDHVPTGTLRGTSHPPSVSP